MKSLTRIRVGLLAAVVGCVSLCTAQAVMPGEKPAKKPTQAWTLDEAQAELALSPHDPYLQYVVLQLARRENKHEQAARAIEELLGGERPNPRGRTDRVDLFSIFTGALAVQESLQLDTMRGEIRQRDPNNAPQAPATMMIPVKPTTRVVEKVPYTVCRMVETEVVTKGGEKIKKLVPVYENRVKEVVKEIPVPNAPTVYVPLRPLAYASAAGMIAVAPGPLLSAVTLAGLSLDRRPFPVALASMTGPKIKSHPWEKMLAGRKPEMSPLALCVPDDFYFVEFHSVNKMIDALAVSDLWSTHVFSQAMREAHMPRLAERLQKQLAVKIDETMRPFYDRVVEEIAVTGSDLYFTEGSDVTLIYRLKQPLLCKAHMNACLRQAEKNNPGTKTSTGEYLGIPYVHVSAPERVLNVYSAYPRRDLHVRSNSLPALRRVLEAIQGKDAEGKQVRRLGDTPEFAYIRTLLPRGAAEEDGLVYLSDPFIRRQVGPQVKLTERRRTVCCNHLRMIGHAAMLYRTEHGKAPASLADLVRAKCAPGKFGEAPLVCPDGGTYSLSADGSAGVCSHHGHAQFLNPCCELVPSKVTGEEAEEYDAFLKDYNQYWRTYFDPIAIRIQVSPERYRLETIVLPLIDNSVYSGLASVLGGRPEPLDALPVPRGNIFSVNFRLNKEGLRKEIEKRNVIFADRHQPAPPPPGIIAAAAEQVRKGPFEEIDNGDLAAALKQFGVPEKQARKLTIENTVRFLEKGLGNQIGLHVYDAEPHVDFNLPRFFGDMSRLLNGRADTDALIGFGLFLLSSANSPAYISVPVQDAAIVDDFLEALDAVSATLARRQNQEFDAIGGLKTDFYRIVHPSKVIIRGNGISVGPVTWRFFTARIGNSFYIATKQFILEDLIAADRARKDTGDSGPPGHAMVRVRPQNWNKTLPDYRLGWCENRRQACLGNLAPLAHVGRAFAAAIDERDAYAEAEAERRGTEVCRLADRLHAAHFFCPDGGRYLLSRDGRSMTCSLHGSLAEPRQHDLPADQADLKTHLSDFAGMTVTLTFLEDGLRGVLTIDRKATRQR